MEKWVDIFGYEGSYQISNIGRVKSLPKITATRFRSESIILYSNTNRHGYNYVSLCKNGIAKSYTIHQLVARHFIPNPGRKEFVNHINGVKLDNCVENLEWVTSKENNTHAIKNGLSGSIGSTNHNAKLTESQVLEIIKSRKSNMDIATEYGISKYGVIDIRRGRRWSHITGIHYKPKKRVA